MTEPARTEALRRQKILDAATRVFERDGLGRASMRGIAREAGCTTGAIYPLFAGKEDIYASLLEQSLDDLYAAVAKAAARHADALDALLAVAEAWYVYYAENPFEADLGLYRHGGGQTRGLGPERDARLNARLLQSLDVFATCFMRLAPGSLPEDERQRWARSERDALFAALIGLLTLDRTGRAASIGTRAVSVLHTQLHILRERFSR